MIGLVIFASISFGQKCARPGIDEKTGKPILIGLFDRTAFQDSNYAWWFNSGYKFYATDSVVVNELGSVDLDSVNVTIVMGTWCSDSRREVPRFFKIIDELKMPKENIKIIGVNRKLKSDGEDISSLDIKRVPTFIFYKNQKEIGRIIETLEVSLENDILKILKKG
ncbi:hypothetical protein MNBD_IGNAVI01-3184 [hydrothermal vent metagenome]|uniref:Thioredoxin n=1 Tax=hydrothermal vent metagenome TaxID=652676 RepID=A0A3B1DD86_9ZZZZ